MTNGTTRIGSIINRDRYSFLSTRKGGPQDISLDRLEEIVLDFKKVYKEKIEWEKQALDGADGFLFWYLYLKHYNLLEEFYDYTHGYISGRVPGDPKSVENICDMCGETHKYAILRKFLNKKSLKFQLHIERIFSYSESTINFLTHNIEVGDMRQPTLNARLLINMVNNVCENSAAKRDTLAYIYFNRMQAEIFGYELIPYDLLEMIPQLAPDKKEEK